MAWFFRKRKRPDEDPSLLSVLMTGERERAALHVELEKARLETDIKRATLDMEHLEAVREQNRLDIEHREEVRRNRRVAAAEAREKRSKRIAARNGATADRPACRLCADPFAPNLSIAEIQAHQLHKATAPPPPPPQESREQGN